MLYLLQKRGKEVLKMTRIEIINAEMTREEILNEMENTKDRIFDLNLMDRWDRRTRDRVDELYRVLDVLRGKLRKMEA